MTETAKLTPADRRSFSRFGISVVVSGKTAVVGSPYRSDDHSGDGRSLRIHRTERRVARYDEQHVADWFRRALRSRLRYRLAMTGNLVVVGAPGDLLQRLSLVILSVHPLVRSDGFAAAAS